MTSPLVEAIRTVPLIIEKGNSRINIPMEFEETSGFPFEREPERDGHFRSQLDDLAKRHPELAEHLGTFSRRRQSSGDDPDGFHRRFERPFGGATDRFERFGFPFDRDNFDPEQYAQQFYKQQPEHQHPQPQSYQHPNYQQQYSHQPQPQEYQQPQQCPSQQNPEEPSASETNRNNIQQSNTTDLGHKQEPVNDRNQRSMSAPPTEKGQRFTSSINIPVNQPQPEESENMAQTQSQQQTDGKTTERIIPIHIEGRDEPVLPKTAPPTYSQPHQTYNAGPQPERIFGQRPEHFTQFVNREPQWHRPGFDQMHQGYVPEEFVRQQKIPQQNVPPFYQQQQQRPAPQPHPQPKEEIPIPVQRDGPQAKQQVPPQQTAPPQPKPAAQPQKPKTPIELIQVIQKDVSELMGQVQQFSGKPRDKQYLYLDEMLTRNLLKLDNIDTQGQETIRSARKEAIKCIEKAISVLETKAAGNVAPPKMEENMEVEEKPQESAEQIEVQKMETDPTPESKAEENQLQPMEASPETTTDKEPPTTEEEKPAVVDPQPITENRAVLVTTENKEAPKAEKKAESTETKEEPPAVIAEEPKPEATCEGQESNLPIAEAVKKFEGKEDDNKEEKKPEDGAEVPQEEKSEEKKVEKKEDAKTEDKKEEKKEKKKGKKKAEKKEK